VAALAAHVGALRAGLVVVPANTAYSEREVAHIVTDVRPAAAIIDGGDGTDLAGWVRRASAGPVVVVGPEVDLPDAEPDRLDAALPDDPALIGYTSGTTGAPKGAVLRHANLLAATDAVRIAWRWGPDDRLVHALPVFHAHGLGVGVYGTLLAGASAVLLPGFDPDSVVEAARAERATLFFGVPTMYHRLARSGRASGLRSLRLCVSGSAPRPAELHARVSEAVGSAVLERYGMTETLMNTSNPYDGERRAGTVGFPLPGVEIRLDRGEILVRGPNVFAGYWERPVANAESFAPAGDGGADWFRTGDLGEEDDGYLVIRGRSKEVIISGGYNVYPAEVEEVLATHPAVAEVAVSGTPSAEWGEVVTAWIVAEGRAPTVDELAEFTADTLAPYKRPRLVRVVEALPRNALGKVVRGALGG
jgi:malonyl-CoA/methylmalonyl-CoA synthetase